MFKRGDGSYMTERKDKVRAIQWYLYNTSGEHIANLQGDMVAFVPTLVVNNTGFAADVVTPWGTRHTIFSMTKHMMSFGCLCMDTMMCTQNC